MALLTVPWVGLQCVIVVFPDHTHYLCFGCLKETSKYNALAAGLQIFFQDWWAEVTQGAKNGGSFSEMMGPSISN